MSCSSRPTISDYRLTITSETQGATCSGWVEDRAGRTQITRQALPWIWRTPAGPVAADLHSDDPTAMLQAELVSKVEGKDGWPLTLPHSAKRVLVVERHSDDGAIGLGLEIGK